MTRNTQEAGTDVTGRREGRFRLCWICSPAEGFVTASGHSGYSCLNESRNCFAMKVGRNLEVVGWPECGGGEA